MTREAMLSNSKHPNMNEIYMRLPGLIRGLHSLLGRSHRA
jgi:hypothetical protein